MNDYRHLDIQTHLFFRLEPQHQYSQLLNLTDLADLADLAEHNALLVHQLMPKHGQWVLTFDLASLVQKAMEMASPSDDSEMTLTIILLAAQFNRK